ncbi:hypothetical protein SGUI_2024 [Serinicoccus hydrothermalis]|uniref:Uncharacterized protein n=1 Tax=Serinicoccus hydrothermalis TaxID=1758689 RepID=A0A1B1ND90_9MICO|nr:hypothetical protein SGUI_2024 [Serinicoccus hydrothermalis]
MPVGGHTFGGGGHTLRYASMCTPGGTHPPMSRGPAGGRTEDDATRGDADE